MTGSFNQHFQLWLAGKVQLWGVQHGAWRVLNDCFLAARTFISVTFICALNHLCSESLSFVPCPLSLVPCLHCLSVRKTVPCLLCLSGWVPNTCCMHGAVSRQVPPVKPCLGKRQFTDRRPQVLSSGCRAAVLAPHHRFVQLSMSGVHTLPFAQPDWPGRWACRPESAFGQCN